MQFQVYWIKIFLIFDFIIIDDCSNDRTAEIIEAFDDKRIKIL